MDGLSGTDRESAAAALAHAGELHGTVNRRGRAWLVRMQLAYGVLSAIVVLLIGLIPGPVGVIGGMAFWVPAVTALVVYATRQPVAHRGMARTHGWMMAVWTVLYVGVLVLGSTVFRDVPAWWIAGAVLVALPAFVAAWVTGRRIA